MIPALNVGFLAEAGERTVTFNEAASLSSRCSAHLLLAHTQQPPWGEACPAIQPCPAPVTLGTSALQAPLSVEFSRQEYWRGLPFPPLRDLPNPGMEPASPALEGGFFPTEPPGKDFPSVWMQGQALLIISVTGSGPLAASLTCHLFPCSCSSGLYSFRVPLFLSFPAPLSNDISHH